MAPTKSFRSFKNDYFDLMSKQLSLSMLIFMQTNSIERGQWIWSKYWKRSHQFVWYKKTWANKKESSIKRSDILHHHIFTLFRLKCESIKIHVNNNQNGYGTAPKVIQLLRCINTWIRFHWIGNISRKWQSGLKPNNVEHRIIFGNTQKRL